MSTELPAFQPRSAIAPAPRVEQPIASVATPPPSVSLHVERLVLQGFSLGPRAGAKVEQAFQAEVNRMLASGELQLTAWPARALDQLRLDDLSLGSSTPPEQLGRALAAALLRGLGS